MYRRDVPPMWPFGALFAGVLVPLFLLPVRLLYGGINWGSAVTWFRGPSILNVLGSFGTVLGKFLTVLEHLSFVFNVFRTVLESFRCFVVAVLNETANIETMFTADPKASMS